MKPMNLTSKLIGLILIVVNLTGCQVGELSFGVEMRATEANLSPTSPVATSPETTPPPPATPTSTPPHDPTPTPVTMESTACNNQAEFVQDLSVQDGQEFQPGARFLKSWRLRNVGSCTWTESYSYVHAGGNLRADHEGGSLPNTVQPGETLDLTVAMTAPDLPGVYLSEWQLQDSEGELFGVGQDGSVPFFARINVIPSSLESKATPYAQSPAAGICPEIEGEIVSMTINPDVPDPRCVIVQPDQRLRVVNNLDELITASLGSLSTSIAPKAEHTFEKTFGEVLMPGVHNLGVNTCCGGSIWLKEP